MRTLEQYGKQRLSKDLWEMLLFVNSPAANEDGQPTSMSETLDAINEGKQAYDLPNVRVMSHTYDQPQPIGQIRKDLWDTLVYDLHKRGSQARTLVINNDSDTVHLRDDYLAQMLFPAIAGNFQAVRAPLRFGVEPAAPTASKLVKFHWYMYTAWMHQHGQTPAVEGNSAIDLADYCAVGGFDLTSNLGEFNGIFNRARDLHAYPLLRVVSNSEAWASQAVLKTSSRRQLATIAIGHEPGECWNPEKMPFTSFDSLREQTPLEAAEESAIQNLRKFISADMNLFSYLNDGNLEHEHISFAMARFGKVALELMGLITPEEVAEANAKILEEVSV
jgi:hypothetical protein